MTEKDWTNAITASFMVLCFMTFTFVISLYFRSNGMSDDSCCCKFILSGIIACGTFCIVLFLCNHFCKPKFVCFSDESRVGICCNHKLSKYSEFEFFCFVDDSQKLDEGMFLGCKKLITVKLPSEIKEIPRYSFSGCSKLFDATIPESVKEICEYAFLGCSSLLDVTIPENTQKVGIYAFANCCSISKIIIKAKNIKIAETAFLNCRNLKEIITLGEIPKDFYEKHKNWLSRISSKCLIKETEKSLGKTIAELKKQADNENNSREPLKTEVFRGSR